MFLVLLVLVNSTFNLHDSLDSVERLKATEICTRSYDTIQPMQ